MSLRWSGTHIWWRILHRTWIWSIVIAPAISSHSRQCSSDSPGPISWCDRTRQICPVGKILLLCRIWNLYYLNASNGASLHRISLVRVFLIPVANMICTYCRAQQMVLAMDSRIPLDSIRLLFPNRWAASMPGSLRIAYPAFCHWAWCNEWNLFPRTEFIRMNKWGGFLENWSWLTFFSNFSINSPSCVLNFDPTEMNVNLPFDDKLQLLVNSTLSSGLDDSTTSASSDACRASLFFSMNWLWETESGMNTLFDSKNKLNIQALPWYSTQPQRNVAPKSLLHRATYDVPSVETIVAVINGNVSSKHCALPWWSEQTKASAISIPHRAMWKFRSISTQSIQWYLDYRWIWFRAHSNPRDDTAPAHVWECYRWRISAID